MSLRDLANITPAVQPFTGDPEIHRFSTHRYHVGFRADCNHFIHNPNMNYAIRRALSEFDWLADLGDYPPSPLYVLVYKVSDGEHVIEPLFRGIPAYRQIYCHGFVYADLQSDSQALAVRRACMDNGGMDVTALAQFERHNKYAALLRAFAGVVAVNDGKVVN